MKSLNMILAAAENNAIGRKGGIPWHISEDFKYFKRTTMGHSVIMGWATWESLGCKPLPGRRNHVLCPQPLPEACSADVFFHDSLEDALAAAGEDAFIIGGGYTYRSAMPYATRIYLTRIYATIEDADTFFPEISDSLWRLVSAGGRQTDPESGLEYEFLIYEKR